MVVEVVLIVLLVLKTVLTDGLRNNDRKTCINGYSKSGSKRLAKHCVFFTKRRHNIVSVKPSYTSLCSTLFNFHRAKFNAYLCFSPIGYIFFGFLNM